MAYGLRTRGLRSSKKADTGGISSPVKKTNKSKDGSPRQSMKVAESPSLPPALPVKANSSASGGYQLPILPSVENDADQQLSPTDPSTALPLPDGAQGKFAREFSEEEEETARLLLSLANTPGLSSASSSRASSVEASAETPITPDIVDDSVNDDDLPAPKRRKKSTWVAPVPPFACPSVCNKSFQDVASFRRHVSDMHGQLFTLCKHLDCPHCVSNDLQPNMVMTHHYKNAHDESALRCTEHPNCPFRGTFDVDKFNKHVESHKLTCRKCLDQRIRTLPFANVDNLRKHIKDKHTQQPFLCKIYDVGKGDTCGRRFETDAARSIHMAHSHKGQFLCAMCTDEDHSNPPMFTSEQLLAKHVCKEHPKKATDDWREKAKNKTFPCPTCGKEYSSSGNRAKHVNSVHKKKRNFQCNKIDVSDSPRMIDDNKESLKWDPEKEGCIRAFANRQSLIDHVRAEHFGLMRWENYRKLLSGELAAKIFARADKKAKRSIYSLQALTGVDPDAEKAAEVAAGAGDEDDDDMEEQDDGDEGDERDDEEDADEQDQDSSELEE